MRIGFDQFVQVAREGGDTTPSKPTVKMKSPYTARPSPLARMNAVTSCNNKIV